MKLRLRFDLSVRSAAPLQTQRGFSLLEVIVAMGLTIGVVLATTAAVANSLHGSAIADLHMSLSDDALNALADVRAVSAYDKTMLASLSGRSATMTRTASNGGIETISVSLVTAPPALPVAPAAPADPTVPILVATATVS